MPNRALLFLFLFQLTIFGCSEFYPHYILTSSITFVNLGVISHRKPLCFLVAIVGTKTFHTRLSALRISTPTVECVIESSSQACLTRQTVLLHRFPIPLLPNPNNVPNPNPWHPRPVLKRQVHSMLSKQNLSIDPPRLHQSDVRFFVPFCSFLVHAHHVAAAAGAEELAFQSRPEIAKNGRYLKMLLSNLYMLPKVLSIGSVYYSRFADDDVPAEYLGFRQLPARRPNRFV